jgi:hypothetical protein
MLEDSLRVAASEHTGPEWEVARVCHDNRRAWCTTLRLLKKSERDIDANRHSSIPTCHFETFQIFACPRTDLDDEVTICDTEGNCEPRLTASRGRKRSDIIQEPDVIRRVVLAAPVGH